MVDYEDREAQRNKIKYFDAPEGVSGADIANRCEMRRNQLRGKLSRGEITERQFRDEVYRLR